MKCSALAGGIRKQDQNTVVRKNHPSYGEFIILVIILNQSVYILGHLTLQIHRQNTYFSVHTSYWYVVFLCHMFDFTCNLWIYFFFHSPSGFELAMVSAIILYLMKVFQRCVPQILNLHHVNQHSARNHPVA